MNKLRDVISVASISVDDVNWSVSGIDAENNLNFAINNDFQSLDDPPNSVRSSTEFIFKGENKIYFQCEVKVVVSMPGFSFEQITGDLENRKFIEGVCTEMAMGHARNMLIYATSMAGLGIPVLLSGVMSTAFVSEKSSGVVGEEAGETSEE
ncbi:hypothetical protein ACI3L1_04255 [Deinococcus sp. SM5_A1]|uniref:hypothetical protein n=1 Tax=Deinococcus sp. SM5_A1 TaxID=3379094 RepID=UPI00385EFDE6